MITFINPGIASRDGKSIILVTNDDSHAIVIDNPDFWIPENCVLSYKNRNDGTVELTLKHEDNTRYHHNSCSVTVTAYESSCVLVDSTTVRGNLLYQHGMMLIWAAEMCKNYVAEFE